RGYEEAILAALQGGINHLDTAVNYRGMASERAVGRALARACAQGFAREEVLVATKGGFVPDDRDDPARSGRALLDALVRDHKLAREEIAGGTHCLAPRYIE